MRLPLILLPGLLVCLSAAGQQVLQGSANSRLGSSLAVADFDGDGLLDVAAGAPHFTNLGAHYEGRVAIVRGGRGSPKSRLAWWQGPKSGMRFGAALAAADQGAHGHPELLIGAPGALRGKGALFLLKGGGGLLAGGNPAAGGTLLIIHGRRELGGLGSSVALGDLNGDGLADLVAAEPFASFPGIRGGGLVLVFPGRRRFKPSVVDVGQGPGRPLLEVVGREGEGLGLWLLVADLNGDGIGDLIMGSPARSHGPARKAGSLVVILGNKKLLAHPRRITLGRDPVDLELVGPAHGALGSASAVVDLDGDGNRELLVAEPFPGAGRGDQPGRVHILPASPKHKHVNLRRQHFPFLAGLAPGETFGSALALIPRKGRLPYLAISSVAANRVVVFSLPLLLTNSHPKPQAAFMPAGGQRELFGAALSGGNLTGEGPPQLVVGAPGRSRLYFRPLLP